MSVPQISDTVGETAGEEDPSPPPWSSSLPQGIQPFGSPSITLITSNPRVNHTSDKRHLPLLPKPPEEHPQKLKPDLFSPIPSLRYTSLPGQQSSLRTAAQGSNSDILVKSKVSRCKRKNPEDKSYADASDMGRKRKKPPAGVPAQHCFSFAVQSNPVPEEHHRKRGRRSCLRCNEQKLKVRILFSLVQMWMRRH